jgi:hypothetical protein
MVKVLTAGGRGNGIPIGPVYFCEIMSGPVGFVTRHTRRGAVASFYVYINFSADPRTWTCAYRTVSSYLKCPSITSGPSIDAQRFPSDGIPGTAEVVRIDSGALRGPLSGV